MSRYWTQQILRKVEQIGLKRDEIDRRVFLYSIRKYSIRERKALISAVFRQHPNMKLLFIDVSRDLLVDINNPELSTSVVHQEDAQLV